MHNEIDNARSDRLRQRMIEHEKHGRCHFCPEGFKSHTNPVIYQNEHWFIAGNDDPYPGSIHHYLIVSKRHTTQVVYLTDQEILAQAEAVAWLVKHLEADAYTILVRSGNMKKTGATLDHLHFHFVSGVEKTGPEHEMIFGPLGYQK